MTAQSFNVGIIGYGLSAKVFHIPLITMVNELNFSAIVQRTPKPDDDAEKDYPGIKSYRTSEELVQDRIIDAVVVTTTPETHYDLCMLALRHNKHGMGHMEDTK